MKLIASNTESKFRIELMEAQLSFHENPRFLEICSALSLSEVNDNTPVLLDHFPDGGADTLRFLVSKNQICTMSLPWKMQESVEVEESIPLDQYRNGLNRNGQIKLAVALEMATLAQ